MHTIWFKKCNCYRLSIIDCMFPAMVPFTLGNSWNMTFDVGIHSFCCMEYIHFAVGYETTFNKIFPVAII